MIPRALRALSGNAAFLVTRVDTSIVLSSDAFHSVTQIDTNIVLSLLFIERQER